MAFNLEENRKKALGNIRKARSCVNEGKVEIMLHVHYASAINLAYNVEKKEYEPSLLRDIKAEYSSFANRAFNIATENELIFARKTINKDWNNADKALRRARDYAKENGINIENIIDEIYASFIR